VDRACFFTSLVFVFMVPWEDIIDLPGLGTAVKAMGLAAGALWVMLVVVTGRFRKPAAFHVTASFYVVWTTASVLWSSDVDRTLVQVMTGVQLLGLVLIVWDIYRTRTAVCAALQMYILGAYVALGSTFVNYFSGDTYYYERFSASGTNPDDLGVILAMGMPMAWYLAISLQRAGRARLLVPLNYAYIPAAFLGIALSGTRTALIGTLPGVMFGLACLTQVRTWVRVTVFLGFVSAGVVLLPFIPGASLERLGSTGSELAGGDLNGRLEIWRQGLVSFADHPLLGVGSNMFRSVNWERKVAHNSFLSVLVESGLVGLSLFGTMVVMAVVCAWRQHRWESRLWLSLFGVWAVGAFALTWEVRKPTWVLFGLVVASAGLRSEYRSIVFRDRSRSDARRRSDPALPGPRTELTPVPHS
jgi:O-antigen ligase